MSNQIQDILAERGERYGHFCDHADITQAIKRAMQRGRRWENLSNTQREALEMVAHKIGRILNGDPNYLDSWVDIEGYVRLAREEMEK